MKIVLYIIALIIGSSTLKAVEPSVKFYLEDGNSKEYRLEDLIEMSFVKSDALYTMKVFLHDTSYSYLNTNIVSIELIDLTKIKINLPVTEKYINIAEIDSIIFISNDCSETTIGNQIWSCKNLDVDHYRNGDEIPQVTDATEWYYLKTGAWCYYDNDPEKGKIYGKLYNWYAVTDSRGLAPLGWHIPNQTGLGALYPALGTDVMIGGKLKSTGTYEVGDGLWKTPNLGATNESGFSALPGGSRYTDGTFRYIGENAFWWNTDTYLVDTKEICLGYSVNNENLELQSWNFDKESGQSVRCIKGEIIVPEIKSITPNTGFFEDEVTLTGTGFGETRNKSYVKFDQSNLQKSEYLSWSDTKIKIKVSKSSSIGKVKLSVTANGEKSNDVEFTVKQNVPGDCKYIPIGTQVWTCKNLDVCYYRNGDPIPQITDSTEWKNLKTGAWCYYNNDTNNGKIYGKLYNWYAVNDPRGLAPVGWFVPEDEDWKTLEKYLGMSNTLADSTGYRGTNEGGKLKEAGTDHWRKPNAGATNAIGFTAIPGSYRGNQGAFYSLGKDGYWWSSTASDTTDVWFRGLSYYYPGVYRNHNSKEYGFSVRCVKGEIVFPIINKINPSTGFIGDEVTLTGTGFGDIQGTSVVTFNSLNLPPNNYLSWSDTKIQVIVPNKVEIGNVKVSVTVNGRWSNEVDFEVLIPCTERDYYTSVKIGPLVWMGENLDVCHYRNGDHILNARDSTKWKYLKTGGWCYYDNDPANGTIYGKLYNWYAVHDPRGLAPVGWHVASNAEWTLLADYVGSDDIAGGKLKDVGNDHWLSPNAGATDEYGFKALGAGYRGGNGKNGFLGLGASSWWWSSTNNYSSYITSYYAYLDRGLYYQNDGFSVRCVKNYNPDTIPCGGRSSYTPVTIGTQVWMGENLDVCTYRNGDPIPQVEDSTEWKNLKTGAWCYYNNDPINGMIYGKLYNWYAVNDPRGLAPDGWKIPSDPEWTQLVDYAGGDSAAIYKLKETGIEHWPRATDGRATDEYGFSALPSGYYSDFGNFVGIEIYTKFWSSTESGQTKAWSRSMGYIDTTKFIRSDYPKANGFAVRCLKVDAIVPMINSIIPENGYIGDEVTINGANFGTSQGTNYVSFNSIKPQQSDYLSWSDKQIKVKVPKVAETGYISITVNDIKSDKVEFTVKPLEPDDCDYVTIGTQKWMCKNLDVSTYRNGDTIPEVKDASDWGKLKTGAWCYYKNDYSLGAKYGKLYNYYAFMDPRGLAPVGWHITSDAEWTVLTDYLGGENLAGGKLKSTGTSRTGNGVWQYPNKGATNETGFSALPGGYRDVFGVFQYLGYFGYYQGDRNLDYSNTIMDNKSGFAKEYGFSVRCIKD